MLNRMLKYVCSHTISAYIILVAFAVIVLCEPVHSDDFTIDSPTAANNGGNVLDGNDSLTITENGSITPASGVEGVSTSGTNNIVINSGTINTTGVNADGINSNSASDTLTNNGSISIAGDDARGIMSDGNDVTITNNGSIATTGVESHGIRANSTSPTVINNGRITTTGVDAIGIFSDEANTVIINNGTISTSENGAWGINMQQGENSSITNRGSIYSAQEYAILLDNGGNNIVVNNSGFISSGDDAIRIEGGDDTVINNSGIISSGDDAIRIVSGRDGTVINNSGTISGDDHAILGGTGDTTLNLLPGSRVIGTVDLGDNGDNDAVNIYADGPSVSLTILNAEQISLSGSGVIAGNTVTTVDSTMENAYSVGFATLADSIHRTLNQHSTFKSPMKPVKLASLDLPPGLLYQKQKPIAWVQAFGGMRDHDAYDDALAYDYQYYGANGGYEWAYNSTTLGLMGGMAQSRAESDLTSFDTEANHLFLGGYGFFSFRNINLSTSIIAGYSDYDNKRFVYDNLNGLETAKSNTEGYFISPSVTLGVTYRFKQDYELRPSLYLAYHLSQINDYNESGTTQSDLTIEDRTMRILSSRLQLALAKMLNNGQEIEFRLGASSRFIDNDETEASLTGTNFRYNSAGDDSVCGFFGGVNFRFATTETLTLVADIEAGGAGGNESYIDANIKLEYRF